MTTKATIQMLKSRQDSAGNIECGRFLQCSVSGHKLGHAYILLAQEWGIATPNASPTSSPRASSTLLSPPRRRRVLSKSASPGSDGRPDVAASSKAKDNDADEIWNNVNDTNYLHRVKLKGTLSSLRPNGCLKFTFMIPKDINLLPGRMYLFRVLGKSLRGIDQKCYDAMANTLCRTLPGVPGAPTRLELMDATSTTVSLKWVAGPRNGNKPHTYRIQCKREEVQGESWVEDQRVESKVCAVVVKNLLPNRKYSFRVCAESDAGVGC